MTLEWVTTTLTVLLSMVMRPRLGKPRGKRGTRQDGVLREVFVTSQLWHMKPRPEERSLPSRWRISSGSDAQAPCL